MTVTTTSDHNMKDGDWVKIADNAISFICEYGVGVALALSTRRHFVSISKLKTSFGKKTTFSTRFN